MSFIHVLFKTTTHHFCFPRMQNKKGRLHTQTKQIQAQYGRYYFHSEYKAIK
jgi:hypothetical protein